MPFWSGDRLAQELSKIIDPFDPDLIDCAAYTMTMGREIYVTPHEGVFDPHTNTKRQLEPKEAFTIPAGQFAFLLTEEKLSLPPHVLGFISMKAGTKFRGLINVSGFHVDPGYDQRLIFSVYNAGPSPVHLQQGDPLFLLWIAELDQESSKKYTRTKGHGFTDIPTNLINSIPGEIRSLQSLSKQMNDQKAEINKKIQKVEIHQARHNIVVTVALALFVGILVWSARDFLQNIFTAEPTQSLSEPTVPAKPGGA